jgi:hypothetical protein
MDGAPAHPVVSALLAESGHAARLARAEAARAGALSWLAPVEIRFRWVGDAPGGLAEADAAALRAGPGDLPETVVAVLAVTDAGASDEGAPDGG